MYKLLRVSYGIEKYARLLIPLVNMLGGTHHGDFLPHEGANNIALALFSFPNLEDYAVYRKKMYEDSDCQEVFKYAEETRCIVSYERSFMKPVFT